MTTIPFMGFPISICKKHGIIDTLPCPWPDCENGINGDSFQTKIFFDTRKEKKNYRQIWESPNGESYYTWKREELPHWFSCRKTLWAEARRQGLVADNKTNKVYHYTNIDGLLGIIGSGSIWLSDYSYLNDKREIIHGFDIINETIDIHLSSTISTEVTELLSAWRSSSQNGNHRVCISSFSDQPDSLSQWKAYGPIAIGFDLDSLALHFNQIGMQAVEYEIENQKKLTEVFVNHLLQAYQVDLSENNLKRIPDVYHHFEQLIELVAFFKDQAFSDEREYRAAYVEYPHMFEKDWLKKPSKHFRVRGNKLLPYVVSSEVLTLSDDDKRELGICEIVIGPEADSLLYRGIREYLDENDMNDIPVIQSKVPYRS